MSEPIKAVAGVVPAGQREPFRAPIAVLAAQAADGDPRMRVVRLDGTEVLVDVAMILEHEPEKMDVEVLPTRGATDNEVRFRCTPATYKLVAEWGLHEDSLGMLYMQSTASESRIWEAFARELERAGVPGDRAAGLAQHLVGVLAETVAAHPVSPPPPPRRRTVAQWCAVYDIELWNPAGSPNPFTLVEFWRAVSYARVKVGRRAYDRITADVQAELAKGVENW